MKGRQLRWNNFSEMQIVLSRFVRQSVEVSDGTILYYLEVMLVEFA